MSRWLVISATCLLTACISVRTQTTSTEQAPAPEPAAAPRVQVQPQVVPPSTGGTHEPNDEPYGDVFFREYGVNPFIDDQHVLIPLALPGDCNANDFIGPAVRKIDIEKHARP